ncbi:IS30 family transposase [Leptospira bandrabouensis]|uniref:IS30 family transposase n=2 Tax=Leptospira bandrabouensis TaxID=2484903 RepID=A0A6H3NUG1_9LEPT|nr:IS30 family transposase [Leptospira bandrabouensis]TGN09086.1 IS30 family transposase [Leptospira bandrabouensis]TGN13748.1 IS30 family transposase [Leptospira bandrabouensis]
MAEYTRFSTKEREILSMLIHEGYTKGAIAEMMGRHRSTIGRELERGKIADRYYQYSAIVSGYKARMAAASRKIGKCKLFTSNTLYKEFKNRLELKWSPVQISQDLKRSFPNQKNMSISHQSIYTFIYLLPRGSLKKEINTYLRRKGKKSKPAGNIGNIGKIPEMISIDERPKEVADRSVPGHWEGDLLIGKNHASALGTIVERVTRTVILVPLKAVDAESVRKAFEQELKHFPKQLKLSMTYDQGKEMSEHRLFTKNTKMKVYFCHPASPWERGTCENTNMLIRDFFPKGTDFSKIKKSQIKKVQRMLNQRPRKTLNWNTPEEEIRNLVR